MLGRENRYGTANVRSFVRAAKGEFTSEAWFGLFRYWEGGTTYRKEGIVLYSVLACINERRRRCEAMAEAGIIRRRKAGGGRQAGGGRRTAEGWRLEAVWHTWKER